VTVSPGTDERLVLPTLGDYYSVPGGSILSTYYGREYLADGSSETDDDRNDDRHHPWEGEIMIGLILERLRSGGRGKQQTRDRQGGFAVQGRITVSCLLANSSANREITSRADQAEEGSFMVV
jgi:hypothetical protein